MNRRTPLLVAPLVAAAVLAVSLLTAVAWLWAADDEYASTAKVYLTLEDTDADQYADTILLSREELRRCADVLRTEIVATAVLDEFDAPTTPEELAGRVESVVAPETTLVEVTVRDTSPERAQLLAGWYAEVAVRLLPESGCADPDGPRLLVTVVDPPTYPTDPVSPDAPRTFLIAGAIGLVVGIALGAAAAVVLRRRQ